jgi:hypothetical protein
VKGSIPGPLAKGSFTDESGRRVEEVHELASVGAGRRRAVLLFGHRNGVPCVGANAPDASPAMDCLEEWENPPAVARLVVGGDRKARTDWLAVVGVIKAPVASISMRRQTGEPEPVEVRVTPKFEWRSFAVMTQHGNLANSLLLADSSGRAVAKIDPSWAYDASLAQGPWAEVRDPVAAASGADSALHGLVFEHSAIRRLLGGRTFMILPSAGWIACDGRSLGAVVAFRIFPPASFEGEIPFREYANEGENVAYREGRMYVEAENITTVEVWVDAARRHVVAIDLAALDDTTLDDDGDAAPDIKAWEVIEEPKPAGGPDDADACPEYED